jgi:hypothetical protein
MHTRRMYVFATLSLALLLGACAAKPVARQEKTAHSLTEMTSDMTTVRALIDSTIVSLRTLMIAAPNDLRAAYDRYARDVSAIGRETARMQERSAQLGERSATWLAGWEKSHGDIQDAELRRVSEWRRATLTSRFDTAGASFETARAALLPFVRDLEDIRTAVANDLTPRGISAVSRTDVVRNADVNGQTAARAIDQATADLQDLDSALSVAEEPPR